MVYSEVIRGTEGANMRKCVRLVAAGVVMAVVMIALSATITPGSTTAHWSSAYSNEDSTGHAHTDWMAPLPDAMPLSQLSIPGTHDTGAFTLGRETTETQAMDFTAQLNAGIRVWDIRLGRNPTVGEVCNDVDELYIFHGFVCQFNEFDDDVLAAATDFLDAHPGETILMRVKEEHGSLSESEFAAAVEVNLADVSSYLYTGLSSNPTLGEMRGKIVILQNYAGPHVGPQWGSLNIQDEFSVTTNWDLADKWDHVKDQFIASDNTATMDTIYVNFLSAAGGSFPYFIASGHSSWETDAPRLLTGWLRGAAAIPEVNDCDDFDQCIDEYPSVDCVSLFGLETCSVAFEGVNILSMNYINSSIDHRTGIVMADFPGDGLISAIVNLNPWNLPPVPDAGGPYAVNEASAVTFDASGSTDPDGDALQYRWDFDGDGTWDTDFSTDPTASHTWTDDYTGTAIVEVTDGFASDTDTATVTVFNVAPFATASGSTIDENGIATVSGTIFDPSPDDTFTVTIDWGEGSPIDYLYPAGSTTFSEQHQYLDDNPSDTPSDVYELAVTVTDDDAYAGTANTTVTVNDIAPVVAIDSVIDETGAEVGSSIRQVLTELRVELAGSFTDIGSQDTHVAAVDWGDGTVNGLGSTAGAVTDSHVYENPGIYTVTLTITDDDDLATSASHSITVVDATGAVMGIPGQLGVILEGDVSSSAVSHINTAISNLIGNNGGKAANGALDMLEKGNHNAALVKIVQALQHLSASRADGGPDTTAIESLLALTAKSVAVDQVEMAEEIASKPNEHRKIDQARDLIEEGDVYLASGEYMDAAELYKQAVRKI